MIGGRKNIIVASKLSVATIAVAGNQEGWFYGWRRRGICDIAWGIVVESETWFESNEIFCSKKSAELDNSRWVNTELVFNVVNRNSVIGIILNLVEADMTWPSPVLWTLSPINIKRGFLYVDCCISPVCFRCTFFLIQYNIFYL